MSTMRKSRNLVALAWFSAAAGRDVRCCTAAAAAGRDVYVDIAGWHLFLRDMSAVPGLKMSQALATKLGPEVRYITCNSVQLAVASCTRAVAHSPNIALQLSGCMVS
jgi:hypothetical protein